VGCVGGGGGGEGLGEHEVAEGISLGAKVKVSGKQAVDVGPRWGGRGVERGVGGGEAHCQKSLDITYGG